MNIELSESQITQSAQKIFRARTDSNFKLSLVEKVVPDDWGRNFIWRYRVQDAPPNFPTTLIVKLSKIGGGHIFNEWASLQFLNQFEPLETLVPAFYGGDEDLELLVIEDLGAVRGQHDLGSILEGKDPELAREGLVTHACKMAKLHATTAGHEQEFLGIRSQFPAYDQPISKDQFEGNFRWFSGILPQLNIATPPGLEREILEIITRVQDPNSQRAYTRGDVCPSNIAFQNGQMRFYDFEMGAFRNIFLSAAYFRISHLSCLNGNLIPLELQVKAEEVYFQALAPLMPSRTEYQIDYAAAAATMLIWILSIYLEKNDRARHLATLHQRIFAALSLYSENSLFTDPFPHTAEALLRLHQKLDSQWAEEEKTILPFLAFRSM